VQDTPKEAIKYVEDLKLDKIDREIQAKQDLQDQETQTLFHPSYDYSNEIQRSLATI